MSITITDITEAMRAHVKVKYVKQCVAAAEYGVSSAFVSAVLNGHKPPTRIMLDDAGIERVVTYRTKGAA